MTASRDIGNGITLGIDGRPRFAAAVVRDAVVAELDECVAAGRPADVREVAARIVGRLMKAAVDAEYGEVRAA